MLRIHSTSAKTRERALTARVMRRLRNDGLLLFTDAHLPSVVSLVVGRPVRGSWLAHPASHVIFHVGETLQENPEILAVPLIRKKCTLVHRHLWPAVVAIAVAKDRWQMSELSPAARHLLRMVDRSGTVRTDTVDPLPLPPHRKIGDVARDLERRLLVYGSSVHSDSGRHTKLLESWAHWRDRVGFRTRLPSVRSARKRLEDRVTAVLDTSPDSRLLPWQSS